MSEKQLERIADALEKLVPAYAVPTYTGSIIQIPEHLREQIGHLEATHPMSALPSGLAAWTQAIRVLSDVLQTADGMNLADALVLAASSLADSLRAAAGGQVDDRFERLDNALRTVLGTAEADSIVRMALDDWREDSGSYGKMPEDAPLEQTGASASSD